jgi:putative glutamine amidotransferase
MTKSSKPLIGVTSPEKGGRILWWFTKLAVMIAGGNPKKITANNNQSLDIYDGFIISGGADINPEIYNEVPIQEDIEYDDERDKLEKNIIEHGVKNNLPLLGICRGMQMINATLGGTLYQKAEDILDDFIPSNSIISKTIGRRKITLKSDTKICKITENCEEYLVNSIHHQAINALGDGLIISAREENGLVQAFEQSGETSLPFIIGIQWHPELMLYKRSCRNLFRALVDDAGK